MNGFLYKRKSMVSTFIIIIFTFFVLTANIPLNAEDVDVFSLIQKGQMYNKSGDYEQAVIEFSNALKHTDNKELLKVIYLGLALNHFSLNNYGSSRKYIKNLLEIDKEYLLKGSLYTEKFIRLFNSVRSGNTSYIPSTEKKETISNRIKPKKRLSLDSMKLEEIENKIRKAKSQRTWGWVLGVPVFAWTGLVIVASIAYIADEGLDDYFEDGGGLAPLITGGSIIISYILLKMITSGNKKLKNLRKQKRNLMMGVHFDKNKNSYGLSLVYTF